LESFVYSSFGSEMHDWTHYWQTRSLRLAMGRCECAAMTGPSYCRSTFLRGPTDVRLTPGLHLTSKTNEANLRAHILGVVFMATLRTHAAQ